MKTMRRDTYILEGGNVIGGEGIAAKLMATSARAAPNKGRK